MGKKDFKEAIDKLIQNKKLFNLVCLALVVTFILLTISIFTGDMSKDKSTVASEMTQDDQLSTKTVEELTYEKEQKEELIDILSKMKGVGKVDVKMNFATSEVKVPAQDKTGQTSVTEETDKQGGERVNKSQTEGSTIVMQSESGQSIPVILQVNKPELTGVIVLAEGATNEKVKYDIQTAVSKLYNLAADKVNVYSMGS